MGVKTCEELLRRGLYLAGVTYNATDTRPLIDLKSWLRSVALGWPWPEVCGFETVNLNAGDYRVGLGNGEDWVNGRYIQRVDFPIRILYGETMLHDNINQQSLNSVIVDPTYIPEGIPDKAGYSRVEGGAVAIIFNRRLRTALNMQINYQYDPAANYTVEDIPWYLNDDTMEYAVAYRASESADGPTAANTLKLEDALSVKVRNDKIKFGVMDNFTLKMNRKPQLT